MNDELITMLRSKTALGRLSHSEVDGVLTALDGFGFIRPAPAAPVAVLPAVPMAADPVIPAAVPVAAPVAAPPAPVGILATAEAAIERAMESVYEAGKAAVTPAAQ